MTIIPTMSFKDPFFNPNASYIAPTLEYFEPTIGDHIEYRNFSRSKNTAKENKRRAGKKENEK